MLDPNYETRPSAEELLQNKWFVTEDSQRDDKQKNRVDLMNNLLNFTY